MFAKLNEIIRHHFGWCPNAGTIRTAPPGIATPPVTINPAQPDGGAGGPGRLDRSFTLATGCIRILFLNKRLLWFSFLTGLVLLFSLITTFGIQALSGISPLAGTGLVAVPETSLLVQGSPTWLALTFVFQLVAMFSTVFLLAGLVTCVARLFSGQTATLGEGLSHAKNHAGSIAGWAAIMAVAGTSQQFITALYLGDIFLVFISMALICIFGFMTSFVIPLMVLEDRSLVGAVMGSCSLIRRTWAEIILCLFVLWLFAFVIAFLSLIPAIAIGFPSGNTGLLSITVGLYMFVLMVLIMIGTTLMGIVLVGLYNYGKTGQLPDMFEGKRRDVAPV
jgi:hypothetical protein